MYFHNAPEKDGFIGRQHRVRER